MDPLDLPIALRRTRRSVSGCEARSDAARPQPAAAAKTSRKGAKRRVRFSEPGLSSAGVCAASSGLTPMIRRVSVGTTPKRRHSSAPAGNSTGSSLPHSGEVNFLPLRQVLDGRVQRRIRRNGLSEEMNTIQQEKRRRAQKTKAEIENLKTELKARDREIYELQNATIVMDTDRMWDLEKQIEDLKDELSKKSVAESDQSRGYNWTLSARDPYGNDFMDMSDDEDQFGEETVAQLACSTPSRARSSFPTPPATSPAMPGTPCFRKATPKSTPMPTPMSHAGVQVLLADPKQQQLEEEVASLQVEMHKLGETLNSYKALSGRLGDKLSDFSPSSNGESPASVPEDLEARIEAMLQSMSDRTCALTQLKAAIGDLGFSGSDAGEMVISLASGFRAARLELEYLTPGEITLPLTSRGAEVLDLMLTRLRAMATKAKEDEDAIDEYHQIELSLRKQLDARVSVMDGLKGEMSKAERLMSDKVARIRELEVANERLKGAVDGYMRDLSELEGLVQQMERNGRDSEAARHAQLESNRRVLCSKEDVIAELEVKLADTLQRSADLQKQMVELQDAKSKEVSSLNQKHGSSLAIRDARVAELRGEMDRVNESLRVAHETVLALRVENGGLQTKMEGERAKAKDVIDAMKGELQRVLQMSQDFLNTPKKTDSEPGSTTPTGPGPVRRSGGGFFAPDLAKRGSYKLRRGHDSGMGLLDEDEVEMF
ncbi:hypothetical protein B0J13DRAFT_109654 [Dactylonectria estremocensis]|uniref:Uncharacterized protein n=1 Tax=Dactylonectria estremocensis TaxID=1079267 RepID=A0A9P9FDQ6_9HYPO|nr:hypothetical protein B0J13DRAFT_109654 [Dactylonectria estremocensis]